MLERRQIFLASKHQGCHSVVWLRVCVRSEGENGSVFECIKRIRKKAKYPSVGDSSKVFKYRNVARVSQRLSIVLVVLRARSQEVVS